LSPSYAQVVGPAQQVFTSRTPSVTSRTASIPPCARRITGPVRGRQRQDSNPAVGRGVSQNTLCRRHWLISRARAEAHLARPSNQPSSSPHVREIIESAGGGHTPLPRDTTAAFAVHAAAKNAANSPRSWRQPQRRHPGSVQRDSRRQADSGVKTVASESRRRPVLGLQVAA